MSFTARCVSSQGVHETPTAEVAPKRGTTPFFSLSAGKGTLVCKEGRKDDGRDRPISRPLGCSRCAACSVRWYTSLPSPFFLFYLGQGSFTCLSNIKFNIYYFIEPHTFCCGEGALGTPAEKFRACEEFAEHMLTPRRPSLRSSEPEVVYNSVWNEYFIVYVSEEVFLFPCLLLRILLPYSSLPHHGDARLQAERRSMARG